MNMTGMALMNLHSCLHRQLNLLEVNTVVTRKSIPLREVSANEGFNVVKTVT